MTIAHVVLCIIILGLYAIIVMLGFGKYKAEQRVREAEEQIERLQHKIRRQRQEIRELISKIIRL